MRVRTIKWKRDPYDNFDRMKYDPWCCYSWLQTKGVKVFGMMDWRLVWPDDEKGVI